MGVKKNWISKKGLPEKCLFAAALLAVAIWAGSMMPGSASAVEADKVDGQLGEDADNVEGQSGEDADKVDEMPGEDANSVDGQLGEDVDSEDESGETPDEGDEPENAIVDSLEPVLILTADEANECGFYNGDVNVAVSVADAAGEDEFLSGIATVDYSVICDGKVTSAGNLFADEVEDWERAYESDALEEDEPVEEDEEADDPEGSDVGEEDVGADGPEESDAGEEDEETDGPEGSDAGEEDVEADDPEGNDAADWDVEDAILNEAEDDEGGETEWETELTYEWNGVVVVDAVANNSADVVLTVAATDNAGNTARASVAMNIDSTAPTVIVGISEDGVNSAYAREGYYNVARTAVITITDRSDAFNADAATSGIAVAATGADGESLDADASVMVSDWETDENDDSIHRATISFAGDAAYEWGIGYTNKAGLSCHTDKNGGDKDSGDDIYAFTIDGEAPFASVSVDENTWNMLLGKLTFGLYSKVRLNVTAEYGDNFGLCVAEYVKTSHSAAYSETELDAMYDEGCFAPYADFAVTADERFVVYLRVADAAGNRIYVSSDGCIVDKTASAITLAPEAPAADNADPDVYGYYNGDVEVEISVSEGAAEYSGIRLIEYWITDGTDDGERITLYGFDADPSKTTADMLRRDWTGSVTVDSEKYHTCDVRLWVYTVDNAGNENTATVALDIDVTAPTVEISYDNNEARNEKYFDAARTATITVTERSQHFDADAATKGICVTATDALGATVGGTYEVSGWVTEQGGSPDGDRHIATVSFSGDANYTLSFSYADKAKNVADSPDTGDCVAPYTFTVDTTAPAGVVTAISDSGALSSWARLVKNLTYGFSFNENIRVTSTQEDATSPIESVSYYLSDSGIPMSEKELSALTEWKDFTALTLDKDGKSVVYLRIVDMAGNASYISTDGIIVDTAAPREEASPKISITPTRTTETIYNADVEVCISVTDPVSGDAYSGLSEISYEVANMGETTQTGILYEFNESSPTLEDLRQSWEGSITVDAAKNNSNDVKVTVYAVDNAGNESQTEATVAIDVTAPTIEVSYDDNSPQNGSYYAKSRTATIKVTERNFDPDGVSVEITNTDGGVPTLSAWKTAKGGGNGDGTTHVATITYGEDGDYTFAISCTDMAGNECTSVSYAVGTANATEFTIDKTVPVVTVSYDNNRVSEGRYFSSERTATVTIREHNFDAEGVSFTQTASLDGRLLAAPMAVWSSDGDVHTATIRYDGDGDYTFGVSVTDLAGNVSGGADYGSSVAACDFTIDTGIDAPLITGVVNGASYKEAVVPGVECSDVNFETYAITLLRTRRDEVDEDVTAQFIQSLSVDERGIRGTFDTFDMTAENDGIYTLTVTVWDKAGNEGSDSVTFTLNRFGSVYAYSQALVDLKDAYVQSVDEELVITEYNPDKLVEGSLAVELTRDGTPVKDVKYRVDSVVNEYAAPGTSGWYQYEYTIAKSNFSEDGVYGIVVSSKDEAGNLPETTNYDDGQVLFRVDTTPGELVSVSGLEEPIVDADSVEVAFELFDAIGLKSATAYLDGKVCQTYAGEDIEGKNSYSGTFTVDSADSPTSVRIVAEDMAGNLFDTDEKDEVGGYVFSPGYDFNREITVSTNAFVRWYADKKRVRESVAVAAVLVAVFGVAVPALCVARRRKRAQG